MKMLYTANGRYIRCCTEEGTRPVIIVCEKEHEVDVQEFMLWSILNWRILREEEIGSYYEKMANNTSVTIHRSWQDCVQRLLVRGLIVAGTGDTEYDALYDELKGLEEELGTVMASSPTVNVGYEVLSELPKERHESPMLSLDKTKEVARLKEFVGDQMAVISWKMDGLTIAFDLS